MKRDNESNANTAGDALDSILSTAKPRPAPSSARKEEIFDELRGEWLATRRASQTRRRYVVSAIAASIVAAVLLITQVNLDANPPLLPPDATMVRFTGNGTRVNDQAIESLLPADTQLRFATGDSIATGNDAALAIAWNSAGSLRVNSSSNVTLVSLDRIELAAGEIYYDSKSLDAQATSAISVDTALGTIRHVGTQFLAKVDNGGVNISVREGRVEFHSHSDDVLYVDEGESVRIEGARTPAFSGVDPTGDDWNWASLIAPRLDVDGRSTHEIIAWISKETGRTVEYSDALAQSYASNDRIRGIGEVDPLAALAIVPIATDLQLDIDKRAIRVRLAD